MKYFETVFSCLGSKPMQINIVKSFKNFAYELTETVGISGRGQYISHHELDMLKLSMWFYSPKYYFGRILGPISAQLQI